jgi:hypothetical protein
MILAMSDRERLLEQYECLNKTFTDPLEGIETIYHYTSANGLRGIVGRHELWLSNTAFVNDTTECKALKSEEDLFDKNDFSNPQVKERWFKYLKFDTNRNIHYIVSFSTTEDFLGQWRAYGSYSIGFETNKLAKSNFNLYECVYNKTKIKDWILEKEKADEWKGDCLSERAKRMTAFNLIYAASMKYKNVSYEAEGEVRLITESNHSWEPFSFSPGMYNQPPIHFRDHSVYKAPLPYVKFFLSNDKQEEDEPIATEQKETEEQLKRKRLEQEMNQKRELLPIKEIRIGPMVHQKEAKLACEILLSEKGYKDVKVILSEIPYRGF